MKKHRNIWKADTKIYLCRVWCVEGVIFISTMWGSTIVTWAVDWNERFVWIFKLMVWIPWIWKVLGNGDWGAKTGRQTSRVCERCRFDHIPCNAGFCQWFSSYYACWSLRSILCLVCFCFCYRLSGIVTLSPLPRYFLSTSGRAWSTVRLWLAFVDDTTKTC